VSPNGKFLLYNESGQTPKDLFLYDLEKRQEYTIVSYAKEGALFTFYNWDNKDDDFFYGIYNPKSSEETIFLKKAKEIK
jgi:hypothetical protein